METTVQVEWLIKAAFKNPTKHYKTIHQNAILSRSGEGVQIAAILLKQITINLKLVHRKKIAMFSIRSIC